MWLQIQWVFFTSQFRRAEREYIVAGDEVVFGKAGQETYGLGRFFSSLQNRVIGGLSFFVFSVNDKHFHPVVAPFIGQTIALANFGFRDRSGVLANLKICKKGTWNERMCAETIFSMLTIVCDLKRIRHQLSASIQMRLAYVVAMFNILLKLFPFRHPELGPFRMSIAEFSL